MTLAKAILPFKQALSGTPAFARALDAVPEKGYAVRFQNFHASLKGIFAAFMHERMNRQVVIV